MKETINHPPHYHKGKYETIKVIDAWNLNYNLGNTVKYISRAGHKGQHLEDLKKARWYLNHEIRQQQRYQRARLKGTKAPDLEGDRDTYKQTDPPKR